MNAVEGITETDKFFEYGIGVGMFVVSVLLTLGILSLVLWVFLKISKTANKTFKDATDNFIGSVERMDNQHREERKLWEDRETDRQKQAIQVQETSNKVVSALEKTIRECLIEQRLKEGVGKVNPKSETA